MPDFESIQPEQFVPPATEESDKKPKRFTFQKEEFAQERIQAVKEAVDELKAEYPEIVSLCLFGSLVKGKSTEGSDIDGYLFIDPEKISIEHDGQEPVTELWKDEIPLEDTEMKTKQLDYSSYLSFDLFLKYNKLIQEKVMAKLGIDDEDKVKHLRTFPINEQIVTETLNHYIEFKKIEWDFERKVKAESEKAENKDIPLKELIEKMSSELEYMPIVPMNIRFMFFLDVGGDIRKYRKQVIDMLLDRDDIGKYIWIEIIKWVEHIEQKVLMKDVPTEIHYPRTLEEAVKIYG